MKRSKNLKKDENKKKKLSAHFINQPPKPSKGAKRALDLLGETSERRAMGKGRPDQRLRSFIVINTDCRSRFLPHSGILTSAVSEIMATGSPGRFWPLLINQHWAWPLGWQRAKCCGGAHCWSLCWFLLRMFPRNSKLASRSGGERAGEGWGKWAGGAVGQTADEITGALPKCSPLKESRVNGVSY